MQSTYLRWILAVLGFSGIIALFFPFADGLDIRDGWEWFGRAIIPVVTFPFLISIGYVAWLVANKPLRWLNPAGYLAAVLFSVIALSGSFDPSMDPSFGDILETAMLTVIPAFFIILGILHGVDGGSGARGLIALQGIYAFHLSVYLASFIEWTHNIGYWLAALALLVMLMQMAVLLTRRRWIVSLYAPAAIVWIFFLRQF